MAEFLTTRGTTARIEAIIAKAKERIVLVSPYLDWSPTLFERLAEADRKGVPITFVYGKKELDSTQWDKFSQLKHLSLYYCQNLHAKCYFNEMELIISSLNLLEYSEVNNREMSVAFGKHETVYEEAVTEVQSILGVSERQGGDAALRASHSKARGDSGPSGRAASKEHGNGTCIRCGCRIHLNRDEPLCDACDSIWSFFENWDYQEVYCHQCGHKADVTKAKPLCDRCFFG